MSKPILFSTFLIIFSIGFVLFFLASPNVVNAQGTLTCRRDSFNTCVVDTSVSPNPNCQSSFTPPECPPYSNCCESQNVTGTCNNVPCESTTEITCTSPDQCFSSCPSGWTITGNTCQSGQTCCRDTASVNPCPSGYYCSFVGGGNPQATCQNNAGVYQSCSEAQEANGNCCLPAGGTYGCFWTGATCETDLSGGSSGIPYSCPANYGHCDTNDTGCTPCENINNPSECINGNPRQCVEQNPTLGYNCDGVFGCNPCFTSPCEYVDLNSCQLACSGQVQTRFTCQNNQCVESGSGEYANLFSCSSSCTRSPEVFCDNSGNRVSQPPNANNPKLATAIGCIPVGSNQAIAEFLLRWGAGIAGGIAIILIIYGGYMVITSSGNPQRIQAGKELITSAIMGLLLLLFAAFLLQFIGVRILAIPGFG